MKYSLIDQNARDCRYREKDGSCGSDAHVAIKASLTVLVRRDQLISVTLGAFAGTLERVETRLFDEVFI
ncbi:hypothetical protein [Methylomicrobium sp. Wu6]|uniref:hypothetical protein n=1 Tax=Methylomicrobium sp. Wu6 TaxID=3107928 RepID=UPI002DD67F0F|nr:hypothetical protein [Methylomicrobium sp. Wu6]MEC4749270.1 hypothetical protein [Methylomicrobium sp. Wu6]